MLNFTTMKRLQIWNQLSKKVFNLSTLFTILALMLFSNSWAQITQNLTSGTSWTCPTGITSIQVEAWGGGGGGGGGTSNASRAGGGGAGGAYVKNYPITVTPTTAYTYAIGSAGTGGTKSSPANGVAGGSTTITIGGTAITAAGGTFGAGGSTATPSGAGGTGATTGNAGFSGGSYTLVSSAGGNGAAGASATGGGGGGGAGGGNASAAVSTYAQAGASSTSGGGAGASGNTTNATPSAAGSPGGGGAGGYSTSSSGASGSNGGLGQITITYTSATQASNIVFSSLSATGMTIGLTRGGGNSVAIFVKDGSGAITNPTNGTNYTANTTLGSGTQLGASGYYCVFNGSASSGASIVTISGLSSGHTYYVQAFEYLNSGSAAYLYNTTAVTANQAIVTYTVTYAGGGSTGGTLPTDNTNYISGASVNAATNTLTKTGYAFSGWSDGAGHTYTSGQASAFTITSNTTLTATWTLSSTYSVTYAGGGSDGGTLPTDATAYSSGASVNAATNTLTRTGYTFAGWSDGAGHTYTSGQSSAFSITTNTILTATWTAINTNLSALSISSGTLSPSFAPGTTSYTASVSNATTSINITPTVSATGVATVTVNGVAATSGSPSSVSLSVGSNSIPVVVSNSGASQTYTIAVTRATAPIISSGAVSGSNTYVQGFAASQTYTTIAVTGSSLSSNITVTPSSSNFVVCATSGGTYTSSITLPSVGGTVYVKLASGLTNASNSSVSGNIQLTDVTDGATEVDVAVTGTVTVASSYTSTTGGDWNNGATWIGGFVPTSGATVSIVNAVTVNNDQSAVTVGVVTINTGGTLTFNNSGSSGKLNAASVTISTGTLLDMTNGGTLTCSTGNITATGTFTAGTGTVVLQGTSSIGTSALALNNLTITSGTTTISTLSISGSLTVSGTGILSMSNGTSGRSLTVAGDLNLSGTGGIINSGSTNAFGLTLNGTSKNMSSTASGNNFSKTTITISGSYTLNGNFDYSSAASATRNITVSGSLNLSTFTLTMGISPITGTINIGTGTLNTACVSTGIPASGTWTGTINYSGASQNIIAGTYNNLTVSGTGTPILGSAITIGGTFTPGGLTYTTAGSTVTITGSSIPAFSFNNLTINNGSGVSLAGAVSVSGTLTLSNGVLSTTSSNLLTITNTASSAISGGSSSAFVNGPLAWTLPNGASVSTYTFPVGNGASYNPFSLVAPTASAAGTVAKVQYATSNSGTFNATLSALNASAQWSITASTGNISAATLNVTSASALGTYDAIAFSITAAGAYASLGGTVSSQSINGSNAISTISSGNTNYFGLGTKAVITVNDPATFSSSSSTTTQINLSATANGSSNNILVLYSTSNSFTTPSNGTDPSSIGLSGSFAGGTILYYGAAAGLSSHTSLTSNTAYNYIAYSYDGSFNYSPGLSVSTATLAVPTNGTITATTTTITVSNAGVTAGGGAVLSARGVAIGLGHASVSSAATHYPDASIATGTLLSQTASSPALTPQTAYNAWAFVSNAGGTNFSASPVQFYTISSPATAAASNVTLMQSAQTSVAVNVAVPATYPATGATKAGYLVVYTTGASAPSTSWLTNGVAPASQTPTGGISFARVGADSLAPTAPSGSGVIISGLSAATQYTMIVVPYTWDSTNAGTYNYATSIASSPASITLSNTNTDYAVFGASTTLGSVTNASKLTATISSHNLDSVATGNNVLRYARYNAADALGYIWNKDGTSTTTSTAFDGTTGTLAETRYVDYIVSPGAGYDLTVNNISVPISIPGTSTAMGYAIAYSVNGGTFTQLSSASNTTPAGNYTATANGTNNTTSIKVTLASANKSTITNISGANISVPQGQNLKVRVIMWRQTTTTSSSTTENVGPLVIAGTTSVAPPTITSSLTASGIVGTPISTYTITGNSSPTSYNATGLPAGLSVNTSNGQITGTPTDATGSPFSVTISATNAAGTGTATLVFTIAAAPVPVISNGTLTLSGMVGSAISTYTVAASNSPTSYGATGLPTGLSINTSTGDITGTPAIGTSGVYNVSITATNSGGTCTAATLVITIVDVATVTSISPTYATAGSGGFTITVNGTNFLNDISTITWNGSTRATTFVSVTQLTASVSSGDIASAGTATVGVTNTGTGASVSTKTFTISNASATWTSYVTAPVTAGSLNTTITAAPSNVYFTLKDSLGAIKVSGNANGLGWAADGANDTANASFTGIGPTASTRSLDFKIAPYPGKNLTVSHISVPIKTGGTASMGFSVGYSTNGTNFTKISTITNSSNTTAINTYSLKMPIISNTTATTDTALSVSVPNGDSLIVRVIMWRYSASTVSNNPLYVGPVVVAGTTSNSATPVITSSLADNGSVGSADSYTITASNGPIVSYSATGLPAGMTLNTTTGVISGTPTSQGVYSVVIGASNGTTTGTATYVYTVGASTAPVINSSLTATGTVGQPFTYHITSSNNPTSYGATGLPSGLIINTSTGYITGTPTTSGATTITITATNATGTSTKSLVLTTAAANYYYYGGTGALDNFSNWYASNGSNAASQVAATSASVFTQGSTSFEIRTDVSTAANAGTWTVSGSGSKIILGNATITGKTLTVSSGRAIAATIDIAAALSGTNTLLLQDVSIPTFGTLNATSTINYGASVAQTITTSANYGNLVVSNTVGASPVLGSTNTMVNLTISSGGILSLGGSSATILSVSGAAVINGTLNFLQSSSTSYIAGNGMFTVNAGATIYLASTSSSGPIQSSITSGNIRIATGTRTYSPAVSYVFQGNGAQTIGAGFPSSCANLTINNSSGVTLSQALDVTGVLTVTSGTFITGGHLTLKSTSITNSAVIAPVLGSISGSVTVERYIPKGYRAYRDICAAGVYSATNTFYNAWQDTGHYTTGYGMFITGGSPDLVHTTNYLDPTSGIDHSKTGYASLYYYKAGWDTIFNTKSVINPYQSYRALIRGDRSFDLDTTGVVLIASPNILAMHNATTLRSTGNVIYGNVTYSTTGVTNSVTGATFNSAAYGLNSASNGYTYIANPYNCPIVWDSVFSSASNIAASYYYLDPTIGSTGAWVSYNASSHTSSNGAANGQFIQAGQGFLVGNTSSLPSILIKESYKSILSNAKTNVFGVETPNSKLTISLMKQAGTSYFKMDGAVAVFGTQFNNGMGIEDATKMNNTNDNLFISEGGHNLSIDARLPANTTDILGLNIGQLSATQYQFVIDASDYTANGVVPYLNDAYKKTTLSLANGISTISFTVNPTIVASYQNRFSIVFKPTTLSVNSIIANASVNDNVASITWNTIGENGVVNYEVEKSIDGSSFSKIGEEAAKNISIASYSLIDNAATAATNYYRIKAVSTDGTITYSNIAKVTYNLQLTTYNLFPNPLAGNILKVGLINRTEGKYSVSIHNCLGQKVFEQEIAHTGGETTHALNINSSLVAGIYNVTIRSNDSREIVYQSNLSVK